MFTGRCPSALSSLPLLVGVDLSCNRHEGRLPRVDLRRLPHLRYLRLAGNPGLRGVAPPSWRYFLADLTLDWDPAHAPDDDDNDDDDDDDNDNDEESSDDVNSDDVSWGGGEGAEAGEGGGGGGRRLERVRVRRQRQQEWREGPRAGGRIREGSEERPQTTDSSSSEDSDDGERASRGGCGRRGDESSGSSSDGGGGGGGGSEEGVGSSCGGSLGERGYGFSALQIEDLTGGGRRRRPAKSDGCAPS